jgi:N-acetylmuramoyl-L-alanine amidase
MRYLSLWIACFLPLFGAAAALHKESSPLGAYLTVPADAQTVIIDPGHGATDLGARTHSPYTEEKRLCLQTARLVKQYLNQLGYKVIMTRSTDTFVTLPRRVEIAAQASGDLFVSVHFNSSRVPSAHGIEVFFCDSGEDRTRASASRRLANSVLSRMLRATEAKSRGVKKGNFYVIRENSLPAILVEGGFLTNPEERDLLRSRDYQEKIARGIADGIDNFLRKMKR